MSNYAAGTKLSELSLADDPALDVGVPAAPAAAPSAGASDNQEKQRTSHSAVVKAELLRRADGPTEAIDIDAVEVGSRKGGRDSASRSTDEFLADATREFEVGNIDQRLWAKALELAGNDAEVAKPAYFRARAAALRVAKRNKRAEEQARIARELAQEEKNWPVAPRRRPRSSRRVLIAGGVGFGLVLAVTGYFVMRPASEALKAAEIPKLAAPSSRTEQATPADTAKAASAKKPRAERFNVSSEDFSKRVAELKAAGNWNVLVLHAVEWTRMAPENADAWNHLSAGYIKLRQFSDALDAATKAAQLAPKDPQAWQNLGDINVALDQPVAALVAYEHAVALNGRDVTSMVQIGLLHAQLGHLPEAKAAFAQVLDLNPLDIDALCGAGTIAQKEGRAKDADAFARQIKAADLRCRDTVAAVPVSVAAVPAAKNVPASSVPAAKKTPASPAAR